jgi:hypothetical protein
MMAIVCLTEGKLQLVRHPADGRVVAFEDRDAAFCFAVSLETFGAASAGTVEAPGGVPLHVLEPGTTAGGYAQTTQAVAA